jgi:hypothetical protein
MKQLLLSVSLLTASASPNVIADSRIRSPDTTPALGRGYSLTTYDVLSTCLMFDQKTEPTYNYDYEMLETKSDGSTTSDVSSSMKASVSWWFIKSTITSSLAKKSSTSRKKHFISTRMSTERYYSSIDDTTASLTPDALALLERGDMIGFFQACGSGYIRSIRRTAELAAVFEFESSSESASSDLAASLDITGFASSGGGSTSFKTTKESSDTKTTIKIKGYGLGLNMDGADTLVAKDLEGYNAAVDYAFRSMQNDNVGMIQGVEVVSWMNNLQFQNAIKFQAQEQIKWDLPVDEDGVAVICYESGSTTATPCPKVRSVKKDTMGNTEMVESIEVKSITMINAEFITGLEAFYRQEMYTVTKFISCMGDLTSMVAMGQGDRFLADHTRMHMSAQLTEDESIKVNDLLTNVLNEVNLEARMNSLQIFVKHFYGKCASQISKHSNDGSMTKYWWDIPECMPGSGPANSGTAANTKSIKCLTGGRSFTLEAGELKCEPQAAATTASATATTASATAPGIDRFLDQFCMPEVDPGIPPAAPPAGVA